MYLLRLMNCSVIISGILQGIFCFPLLDSNRKTPDRESDFRSTTVSSKGLESRICGISNSGDRCTITHTLRWQKGPTWGLKPLTHFKYTFLAADGSVLCSQQRLDTLADGFLLGIQAESTINVTFDRPRKARYVIIEYPGTGLVTKPISLFPGK